MTNKEALELEIGERVVRKVYMSNASTTGTVTGKGRYRWDAPVVTVEVLWDGRRTVERLCADLLTRGDQR